MQPVHFQCGHCGNLMAVSPEFLGQQVRCPTCQQVVVAPAQEAPPQPSPPAAPDEPTFQPETSDHEDIFTPPVRDDLFDQPAATPRLELPEEPGASMPSPTAEGTATQEPTAPTVDQAQQQEPAPVPATLHYVPPQEPSPAPAPGATAAPAFDSPQTAEDMAQGLAQETGPSAEPNWMDAGAPPDDGTAELPGPTAIPRRRSTESGWFLPLVLFPLISYSILMTLLCGYLVYQIKEKPPSPFERLPDIEGDHPGVTRKKRKSVSYNIKHDKRLVENSPPAKLRVKLGKKLTIGKLEVTPTHVERKKVARLVENYEDQPLVCKHPSLVLHLHLRNISDNQAFYPLDNFFDRKWQDPNNPPLTSLKANGLVFPGGPAEWYRPGDKRNRRERIQGRTIQELRPGEEMDSFVCTDGNDRDMPRLLARIDEGKDQKGKDLRLLWKVRVRRGMVTVKGKNYSACAVIGVEFSEEDIGKPEDS